MVAAEDECSSIGSSSRANPSRGGDAKPGIFLGRPPGRRSPMLTELAQKESIVKANLARFTGVLTLLASLALTLGAGLRWH
jgi:hypothetical protein